MEKTKKNKHWRVLVGCTLLNLAGIGIIINAMGLYFNPIVQDMGYSRVAISMLITITALVNMLVMLFIGKLYKKYSTRLLVLIFGLIGGAGYTMYSMCQTLTQFYTCAIFVGIGVGGFSMVPVSILINRWFDEKRGVALGIAFAGSGIGGMIFAPITTKLIYTYGYKTSFLVHGIVIIVTVIMAYLMIINKPEDIGLKPYGYEKAKADNDNIGFSNVGITFKEATKKPYFYALLLVSFIVGVTNLGTLSQVPSFLTMNGYGQDFVALVVTLFNGMLIFGKLSYGTINDKIGTFKGNIYVISLWIAAVAVLPLASKFHFIPYLYIIFAGLGNPVATVALPIWTSEIFGKKDYEIIYPALVLTASLGTAFGVPISAMIADKTGSFNNAFIGFALALVIALLILQVSYKSGKNVLEEKMLKCSYNENKI